MAGNRQTAPDDGPEPERLSGETAPPDADPPITAESARIIAWTWRSYLDEPVRFVHLADTEDLRERCAMCGGPVRDEALTEVWDSVLAVVAAPPDGPAAVDGRMALIDVAGRLLPGELSERKAEDGLEAEPDRWDVAFSLCSLQCNLMLRAIAQSYVAVGIGPRTTLGEMVDEEDWGAADDGGETIDELRQSVNRLIDDEVDREILNELLSLWRDCAWCREGMDEEHRGKVVRLVVAPRATAPRWPLIRLVRVGGSIVHAWEWGDDDNPRLAAIVCSERCRRAVEDAVATGRARRM